MIRCHTPTRASIGLCIALLAVQAMGSSTIYDGIIKEVEAIPETRSKNTNKIKTHEDVKLTIRSLCSPYSSETVHSWIMTHRDGDYRDQVRRLREFRTYFIDEVPVSREQLAKVVKPGMRMITFENRAFWYFIRVETRNPGSQTGRLVSIEDGVATLARPQHKYTHSYVKGEPTGGRRVEDDGKTHFTQQAYPPLENEVAVDAEAQVIAPDGSVAATDTLGQHLGTPVFFQPARAVQRVELIPPGFGDWDLVLNQGFAGDQKQMQYSALHVMRSTAFDQRTVTHLPADPKNEPKDVKSKVFDAYLIAGWREPGEVVVPIYRKGEWNIVDGYYSNLFNFRHLLLTPGRHVVSTSRRGRYSPDALAYSSEMPAAWGTITKIDDDTVTVQAPEIEGVTPAGEQTITIASNAEFVHLGEPTERAEVLKPGTLIKVFNPHPARFYLDQSK